MNEIRCLLCCRKMVFVDDQHGTVGYGCVNPECPINKDVEPEPEKQASNEELNWLLEKNIQIDFYSVAPDKFAVRFTCKDLNWDCVSYTDKSTFNLSMLPEKVERAYEYWKKCIE